MIHILAPALFGPISRYLFMKRCEERGERCVVDYGARFDKRLKSAHRFTICDVHGPLDITIPIAKGAKTWADTRISDHDSWWTTALTSLESAYGRTPYFEFYIDRFLPFFSADTSKRFGSVAEMTAEADRLVCPILDITIPLTPKDIVSEDEMTDDLRPIRQWNDPDAVKPYWQIRADSLGFVADLSVLDLIFNMGPESMLVITDRF